MENTCKKKYLIHNLNSNHSFSYCLFFFIALFQLILTAVICIALLKYSNYQQKLFENEIKNFVKKYYTNMSEINNSEGYILVNLTQPLIDQGFGEEIRLKRQHKVIIYPDLFLY